MNDVADVAQILAEIGRVPRLRRRRFCRRTAWSIGRLLSGQQSDQARRGRVAAPGVADAESASGGAGGRVSSGCSMSNHWAHLGGRPPKPREQFE